MVFLNLINFVRSRGPDEFWRKRKIFKLSAHFLGRRRNCYSIAVRNVHRALVYATKGRRLKKQDMIELWTTRITAGCEQHGIEYEAFQEGLIRNNILLNRKVLSELAAWEPKTFETLAKISRDRGVLDGLNGIQSPQIPNGVIGRGTTKNKLD